MLIAPEVAFCRSVDIESTEAVSVSTFLLYYTIFYVVGLGMAALFTSMGLMADVLPCADLPLFLMSGAFLRISSLPFWLYPVKYISHFYYGMDAMSNIYWRQIDYIGKCVLYSLLDILSISIVQTFYRAIVLSDWVAS